MRRSFVDLVSAPDVAEREVATVSVLRRDQARVIGVGAVHDARGEAGVGGRALPAAVVSLHAVLDAPFCESESVRGPNIEDRASHDDVGCRRVVCSRLALALAESSDKPTYRGACGPPGYKLPRS